MTTQAEPSKLSVRLSRAELLRAVEAHDRAAFGGLLMSVGSIVGAATLAAAGLVAVSIQALVTIVLVAMSVGACGRCAIGLGDRVSSGRRPVPQWGTRLLAAILAELVAVVLGGIILAYVFRIHG